MSPTFEAVQKLVAGLSHRYAAALRTLRVRFAPAAGAPFTRAGERQRHHPTATYEHELLCTELTKKRMIPFKTRVRACAFHRRVLDGWVRHRAVRSSSWF